MASAWVGGALGYAAAQISKDGGAGRQVSVEHFQYSSAGTNSALVVIFSSYGSGDEGGTTAFALPRFEFVKSLEELNISCLFVRDVNRHWYHSGVAGLGDDIPSVASSINEYARRHPVVATLGHSMGGYAALMFGALCEVDVTIATAPQVSIAGEDRWAWKDVRWRKKIVETRGLSKTPEYFNLRNLLSRPHKTRHSVYYGQGHDPDNKHAEHIADVSGVHVTALTSGGHNSAKVLRDSGRLQELLTDLKMKAMAAHPAASPA
jgi:hypothetical protein